MNGTRPRGRPRRTVAAVILSVTVATPGALAGAVPVARAQDADQVGSRVADVRLAYTCQLPAGPQPVGVHVAATFPATSAVGEPIAPTEVTATATLPPAASADLTGLAAATVAGTARLTTVLDLDEKSTTANWPLQVAVGPVQDGVELVLVAAGPVAPVTLDEPGALTFSAGDLALRLRPRTADGTETDPAELPLACVLDEGQDARLSTVAVGGEEPSPPEGGRAQPPPGTGSPGPGAKAPRIAGPLAPSDAPPGCFQPPTTPTAGPACTFIAGYANVNKLNGSVLLAHAPNDPNAHLQIGEQVKITIPCPGGPDFTCLNWIDTFSSATVTLPPASGSFLAFGFMPITAELQLTELERADILSHQETRRYVGNPVLVFPITVTATSKQSARVLDVTVNGVPLDVGPGCRTADDMTVVLTGGAENSIPRNPEEYTVTFGGVLRAMVDIPAFTGCIRAGEDLSPLFTGSVSGPGNFLKLTQSAPCTRDGSSVCPPPEVPEPRR